jgi:hypothetical protein
MSFEKIVGRLGIRPAGVAASSRFFRDLITGRLLTVGDHMPVDAGVLGAPPVIACLGDERPDVSRVSLIGSFEIIVGGVPGGLGVDVVAQTGVRLKAFKYAE